jgi:hypothetical protein
MTSSQRADEAYTGSPSSKREAPMAARNVCPCAGKRSVRRGARSCPDAGRVTCNGVFDQRSSLLRSGLLRGDGTERPPRTLATVAPRHRRRFLHDAEDVMRTKLRARVVTLRACSAGQVGNPHGGDELDGLTPLVPVSCLGVGAPFRVSPPRRRLWSNQVIQVIGALTVEVADLRTWACDVKIGSLGPAATCGCASCGSSSRCA